MGEGNFGSKDMTEDFDRVTKLIRRQDKTLRQPQIMRDFGKRANIDLA